MIIQLSWLWSEWTDDPKPNYSADVVLVVCMGDVCVFYLL